MLSQGEGIVTRNGFFTRNLFLVTMVKGSQDLAVFVVAAMADCIVVAVAFDYYTHNLEILNLTVCSAAVHAFYQCIDSSTTRQQSGT